MERRWISLENVIRDGISLPNEIMEISRQTKDIFYSWGGVTIQSINGFLSDDERDYLGGDIVFLCEIIPNGFRIHVHTLGEIADTVEYPEDLYSIPFFFGVGSDVSTVELPSVFFPAKHIFANVDKLNQAVHAKLHTTTVTNPGIDQRCETSYKTLIAALLSNAGKYPWGERGGKAAAVKWLARELESLSCAVSEKTIGKHLDGLPDAIRKKEIAPISKK